MRLDARWPPRNGILLSFLLLAWPLGAADQWPYWIETCTPALSAETRCKAADPELARWALEAWQRSANSTLLITAAPSETAARLRIHWVSGRSQLYGEARPIAFEGKRGAEVYVLPQAARAGEDPLDRETVVFLTCLHETGHALGLAHTDQFADIMYSFQFGGDIAEYFGRYRRRLRSRSDISRTSAISPADQKALLAALREQAGASR